MLTQLRLAGKLEQAAGIVFGECVDCTPSEYKPFVAAGFSLGEALDNLLGGLKTPVLSGLTFGHTANQLTFPFGVTATLDADAGILEISESGVTPWQFYSDLYLITSTSARVTRPPDIIFSRTGRA